MITYGVVIGQPGGQVMVMVVKENVGRGCSVQPQCVVTKEVVLVVRPVGHGSIQVPFKCQCHSGRDDASPRLFLPFSVVVIIVDEIL